MYATLIQNTEILFSATLSLSFMQIVRIFAVSSKWCHVIFVANKTNIRSSTGICFCFCFVSLSERDRNDCFEIAKIT